MAFTSWRGVLGCVKPTLRPGGLEELIRMLPEGIGVIPLFLGIKEGSTDEFKRMIAPYEPLVAQLAEIGCDLIHPGPINDVFSKYFVDAGFDVLAMEGISVPFDQIGQLSSHEVYAHVKRAFLKHRESAQAIYLLGSGWRVLPVIDLLEQDLGVPVIHPVPARCWEIQHRLSIRQPVAGFRRLLAEMINPVS